MTIYCSVLFLFLSVTLSLRICVSLPYCMSVYHFFALLSFHFILVPSWSLQRRTVHLLKRFSAMMLLWLMHTGNCNGNEISITGNFCHISLLTGTIGFGSVAEKPQSSEKKCGFFFYCSAMFVLVHF